MTAPTDRKTQARRGLAIYFAIVVVVSAFLEWKILQTGDFIGKHRWLILMLMYTPTLASVIARVALREGIRDISFRFGGRKGGKALLLAWLFPLWVGLIAYGAAWAFGLAQFQAPMPPEAKLYYANATVNFLAALGLMLTLGSAFSCISAAGEEFGWRGYMLTRLIDAGVPQPLLVSGIIWGLWHTPLILSGQYASGAHPRLSALLFVADVIAAGYLAGYVRLRSGSVWPAVLFHGAWNAIIQGAFDRATMGTPLAVGESGYLTAAVSLLTVAWILRKKWTMYRRPGEPMEPDKMPAVFPAKTAGTQTARKTAATVLLTSGRRSGRECSRQNRDLRFAPARSRSFQKIGSIQSVSLGGNEAGVGDDAAQFGLVGAVAHA